MYIPNHPPSEREIRASYDQDSIIVYQAFNPAIADAAVQAQTFVPPFKKARMTWIKPSFLWMMYRSNWAGRENQERILEIRISRAGFEWALEHSCLSSYNQKVYESEAAWKARLAQSPVRIQWDPEKDIRLKELPWRSIQIGLTANAVDLYVDQWITQIRDITSFSRQIYDTLQKGSEKEAINYLPVEEVYPLNQKLAGIIGASQGN